MTVEPNRAAGPGWSPPRVELLRLHYDLGLSAAISAELIGEVSKNAVISKRRRLGLMGANPLRSSIGVPGCAERTFESPFVWTRSNALPRRPHVDVMFVALHPLPFMDLPAPADANPKTLVDRVQGECAWPLGPAETPGDYRTRFCCAPVSGGRAYCRHHLTRAFRAPEEPVSTARAETASTRPVVRTWL